MAVSFQPVAALHHEWLLAGTAFAVNATCQAGKKSEKGPSC
jgi:hypothetical protein